MFNNFNKAPSKKLEKHIIEKEDMKMSRKDKQESAALSRSRDPLYTKTEGKWAIFRKGANHKNTADVASVDYLEDSEASNHADPSYQFKTAEGVVDTSDTYQGFENEDITQDWKKDKPEEVVEKEIIMEPIIPTGEGLINEKTEEEIIIENETKRTSTQRDNNPIKPVNIEKVSVNREEIISSKKPSHPFKEKDNLYISTQANNWENTLNHDHIRANEAHMAKFGRPYIKATGSAALGSWRSKPKGKMRQSEYRKIEDNTKESIQKESKNLIQDITSLQENTSVQKQNNLPKDNINKVAQKNLYKRFFVYLIQICYHSSMKEIDTENHLMVFTDGSSLGNPGPGGWGTLLIFSKLNEAVELGGSKPSTTNNAMELTAIASALSYTEHNTEHMHVFTDSQYAINGITGWMYGWSKNGWRTKDGSDIKNKHTWQSIYHLVEARGKDTITWHHVRGHVGVPGNERVDDIARELAEGKHVPLYRGALDSYPTPNILDISIDTDALQKRTSKSAKAYSYLSLIDGVLEKHATWTECEARVKGQNAKFKKAISPEHEQEILVEWGIKK